jgi:hypothetical protein
MEGVREANMLIFLRKNKTDRNKKALNGRADV